MMMVKNCSQCQAKLSSKNTRLSVLTRKRKGGYCRNCVAKYNRRLYHTFDRAKKEKYIIQAAENARRREKKIKILVFKWYGGLCVCCKEKRLDFLSLDHIKDDGFKYRNKKGRGGTRLYQIIRKKGLNKKPNNLQILCYNCQMGKRFNNGFCPHHPRIDLRK